MEISVYSDGQQHYVVNCDVNCIDNMLLLSIQSTSQLLSIYRINNIFSMIHNFYYTNTHKSNVHIRVHKQFDIKLSMSSNLKSKISSIIVNLNLRI